uniref:Uncharacterized protein n=1 Tax=Schistosoma curassoni TaxID=6186 RepID=A0A183JU64_9TREM
MICNTFSLPIKNVKSQIYLTNLQNCVQSRFMNNRCSDTTESK